MKRPFYGTAKYADMTGGYRLYASRKKKGEPVDIVRYSKVVKAYCRRLAERLGKDGMVQLPCGLGLLAAAMVRRKPRYKDGRFVGIGRFNPRTREYDGTMEAFTIVSVSYTHLTLPTT